MIGEPFKLNDRERDEIKWNCGAGPGLLTRYAPGEFTAVLRLQPDNDNSDRLDLGILRKPQDDSDVAEKNESWVPLIKNVTSLEISYFRSECQRLVAAVARRKPAAVAREGQRRPPGRNRSVGSSHPAEANTVLCRQQSYDKTFAKLQTRFRRCAAVGTLGVVLACGVVFAWALNINSRLTVSATANRVLSAEAMASSGAEVALNPDDQACFGKPA